MGIQRLAVVNVVVDVYKSAAKQIILRKSFAVFQIRASFDGLSFRINKALHASGCRGKLGTAIDWKEQDFFVKKQCLRYFCCFLCGNKVMQIIEFSRTI